MYLANYYNFKKNTLFVLSIRKCMLHHSLIMAEISGSWDHTLMALVGGLGLHHGSSFGTP